ncbi:type I restriction enzyme HsdR N-terminal domain-containing protein [Balneolales bacterium ANBcel1]|nr:type I restriction enzyme HsdR N-terminal domain-containing protein [Balneolales bacterium ANBcel1]
MTSLARFIGMAPSNPYFDEMREPLHTFSPLAAHHYPQFRFRDGMRLLWNPLEKKTARIRPEERVRLQVIDYLTLEAGFSPNRIATERAVPSRYSRGRTDVLCYDTSFAPLMLVECKAENVVPGPKAATQSAVYNRFVKAPYILLTNGLHDALFHVTDSLEHLPPGRYPSFLSRGGFTDSTSEYWMNRGFLHNNMEQQPASLLSGLLCHLFHVSSVAKSYIRVSFPDDGMPLHHYYALLSVPGHTETLYAFTLMAISEDQTALSVISNSGGRNTGCLRMLLSNDGSITTIEHYRPGKGSITLPPISGVEEILGNLPLSSGITDRKSEADPNPAGRYKTDDPPGTEPSGTGRSVDQGPVVKCPKAPSIRRKDSDSRHKDKTDKISTDRLPLTESAARAPDDATDVAHMTYEEQHDPVLIGLSEVLKSFFNDNH